ncbi:MAG: hypothetical protein Q8M92_05210, partial [Candidatus Subteraquimicrobiales bacterium]|nr:hypothetical protein [Candidatus Subteraquimicrobiales bacterium]
MSRAENLRDVIMGNIFRIWMQSGMYHKHFPLYILKIVMEVRYEWVIMGMDGDGEEAYEHYTSKDYK